MTEIWCDGCGTAIGIDIEAVAYGSLTGVYCPHCYYENTITVPGLAQILIKYVDDFEARIAKLEGLTANFVMLR